MNKEVKQQWVAALRSGEYKQGKNALRRQYEGEDAEFCCLGVLCDLAVKAGFSVVEVPITFRERQVGTSKMSPRIAIEAVWKVPALKMRRDR